jgi:hypothetical protein
VLDSESQRAVVRDVMENEIVPGLDAVGLGASYAWQARLRGPGTVSSGAKREDLVFGGPELLAPVFSDDSLEPPVSAPLDPTILATSAVDRAAVWLSAQVGSEGAVGFSLDAKSGAREAFGPLHHGRAAIVVRALASHGGHAASAKRASDRLAADVRAALAGRDVPTWPDDPALLAATLALVSLAGIDVRAALLEAARAPEVLRTPWYAAQVCTALGRDAPEELYRACALGLDADPWAPWTAMAARARDDAAVLARAEEGLVRVVSSQGAVSGPGGPEVARTAATVEALAPFTSKGSLAAAERAQLFLQRVQLAELGEPDHADAIDGAFPLTPTSDVLRTDVTAHAVLALLAWQRR